MTLLIPKELDTRALYTLIAALTTSDSQRTSLKTEVSDVEHVELVKDGVFVTGAAEIVKALSGTDVANIDQLLSADIKSNSSLGAEASVKLASDLPLLNSPQGALLFAGLHALVSARSRMAISKETSLVMWYQAALNDIRIRTVVQQLQKFPFKAPQQRKPSGIRVPVKDNMSKLEAELEKVDLKSVPEQQPRADKSSREQVSADTVDVESAPTKVDPAKVEQDASEKVAPTAAANETQPESAKPNATEPNSVITNATEPKSSIKVSLEASHLRPSRGKEILPEEGKRNILITSALPYVNNVPHLGNIIGSVLSADFFSRWTRGRNYNSLFICGTDEYGTATETKALEEKVTPQELCAKYHKLHKEVYDWFQIDFDYFGRTSTEQQTEVAQKIFLQLNENGFLEEQSMVQLFCEKHQGFLADRYVEGTCPKCGYKDARGDQCDGCGGLLDPFELIEPRCKLDSTTPVRRDTNHVFLSLDKLQPRIQEWVAKSSEEGQWSKNSRSITNTWLRDGLHPRAITRDLKWGTPVPREGYENKVLYVWFDAPIGYPSITANYTKNWEQWWKNPENVKLYQFMGKDNVPFHTVIFPGCELGTNENWTLLHHLSTTDYLQYEGGKFSKSRNIGVFGDSAKEIGISPSVWRYYLAHARPETDDSQFSWSDFVARNNNELLSNLGNLANRVIRFANAKLDSVIPEFDPSNAHNYDSVVSDCTGLISSYNKAMEYAHLREGLEIAMRLSARGNQFLQDNKLDNALLVEKPEQCAAVIGVAVNLLYILCALIEPFMPETAEGLYQQLNLPPRLIPDEFSILVRGGHTLGKAKHLFQRIEISKIDEWKEKYGDKAAVAEKEAKKKAKAAKKKAKAAAKAKAAVNH